MTHLMIQDSIDDSFYHSIDDSIDDCNCFEGSCVTLGSKQDIERGYYNKKSNFRPIDDLPFQKYHPYQKNRNNLPSTDSTWHIFLQQYADKKQLKSSTDNVCCVVNLNENQNEKEYFK